MIETTCQCGAIFCAPEASIGQPSACASCGQALTPVSAENLADGAGAGDFDAHLVIEAGPDRVGQQILLGGVPEITVGKLPDKHITLFGGNRVSRYHCSLGRLDFGPSRWEIRDNKSTNGVLINGSPISTHQLQNHDLITIGDYDLRFVCTFEQDTAASAAPVASVAAAPVVAVAKAASPLQYGTYQDIQERLLGDADQNWVTNLRNAASFMIWAICINVLSSCIPKEHGLKMFIDFSMAMLSWFAAWLLTSPDPGTQTGDAWDILRIALRVVASIKVGGELTIGLAIATDTPALRIVGGLIALAFVPQLFMFLLYLRHLALRIPNKSLANNCIVVMIGLPASVAAVFAAAIFIGAIRPAGTIGSGHLGMAAAFAFAGLGGLLLFSFWYLVLLIWFRQNLS